MSGKYEVTDFQTEVIAQSYTTPVMVDFWADWCGPCHMLEPILKEMLHENNDRWKLVKVDTESNQELASEYNIQGIPAIRVFYKGSIIAEYNGLMYKKEFQRWLEPYLPNASKDELAAIKEKISQGDNTDVVRQLEKLVKKAPELQEARVLLAIEIVRQDPERAADLVDKIYEDSEFFAEADAVKVVSELYYLAAHPKKLADGPVKADMLAAIHDVQELRLDNALEKLMEIIMIDKDYHKQIARRAVLAIFTILGNSHDITRQYRKRFDMALY